MVEYPRMLYKTCDEYLIVEDKESEKKARRAGFKHYADLMKQTTGKASDNELHNTTIDDSELVTS
jgi:hypothetical protein